MIDIKHIEDEFIKYTDAFDMSNPNIRLKYDHTFRVCEQSVKICESLGLNEEDTLLAYLIALLHDIGRFEQIRVYNTFNDSKSIDHADFGCKLLFEEGLIRKFILDTKYDKIIEIAVRNHNKLKIEEGLDKKTLMHSKIIRDIDKLDILNILLILKEIKISPDDSPISKPVNDNFINNLPINLSEEKNENDRILLMMAYIFDLNYNYSYKYIKEKGYIKLFYERLGNNKIFDKYLNILNIYLERKCNEC